MLDIDRESANRIIDALALAIDEKAVFSEAVQRGAPLLRAAMVNVEIETR